jgi:hypothetical protein
MWRIVYATPFTVYMCEGNVCRFVCVVPAVFTDAVTLTTSDTPLEEDTPVANCNANLRDKLLRILDVCSVGPSLILVDPPSLSICGMIL